MGEPTSPKWRWVRGPLIPIALVVVAASCAGSAAPSRAPKSLPALKLAVLAAVGGPLDYCDPDQYPIPRGSPIENAQARLEVIKKDRAAFAAILEHEHLSPNQRFTPDQVIAISEDYKQMQRIELRPAGGGYRFSVLVRKPTSPSGNQQVSGTVAPDGTVKIERRTAGREPMCPICLAAGVRIATPLGGIPVQDVTVGMSVWTTDTKGRRIPAVVLETGRMEAPLGHHVAEVTLADGRKVLASPGHPTADGQPIGELRPGDRFDGSRVVAIGLVDYAGGRTFDLLPSGPTGTYFANGVLLGSSLSERASPPSS
jgi:hypothetical protein